MQRDCFVAPLLATTGFDRTWPLRRMKGLAGFWVEAFPQVVSQALNRLRRPGAQLAENGT